VLLSLAVVAVTIVRSQQNGAEHAVDDSYVPTVAASQNDDPADQFIGLLTQQPESLCSEVRSVTSLSALHKHVDVTTDLPTSVHLDAVD